MHWSIYILIYLASISSLVVLGCIPPDGQARIEPNEDGKEELRHLNYASANWIAKKREREKWLKCHHQNDINCHEYQKLVQLELGSYMLYLGAKGRASRSESRYLARLSAMMDRDVVAGL